MTFRVSAATWYVDNSAPGANTGSSWSDAWRSFGTVNWSNVKPGDTVYISGGASSKIYSESLVVGGSGTAGNPITISAGVDTGHDGTVIIDSANARPYGIKVSQNYIVIDGVRGDAVAGRTNYGIRCQNAFQDSSHNGYGIYSYDSPHDITIRHVEVYGTNQVSADDNSCGVLLGSSCYGIQVDRCWVHGPATPYANRAQMWHGTGMTVWSGSAPTGTGFTRVVISSNKVEYLFNDGIRGGNNCTLSGNEVSFVHGSGHSDSLLIQSGSYAKVVGNYVHDSQDQNIYLDMLSDVTFSDIYVYNNICVNTNGFGVVIDTESASSRIDNLLIANNTFYTTGGYAISSPGRGMGATNVSIQNNIFGPALIGGYQPVLIRTAFLWFKNASAFDYNVYRGGSTAVQWNTSALSLAGLQALSPPRELHGKSGNPSFMNVALRDFHLSPTDAVAIDAGLSLDSLFNSDKDGVLRPQGLGWDVGAYEYTSFSGTNPIVAVTPGSQSFGSVGFGVTTNLSFTVQNVGTGTLSGTASVSAPFSISSGGTYSLGQGQSQVVTVQYTAPPTPSTNVQTVTFTGGGGASATVLGIASVSSPVVSPIKQSGADVDPNALGLQIFAGSVVQYSGSASDPGGYPLSWQWLYTVNGGPETVLLSGTGTVASVSYNYTLSAVGSTYVWKLRVSNGYTTSESDLTVAVEAAPVAGSGLTFQAGAAVLTSPMVLATDTTGTYCYQPIQTSLTNAGMATFYFVITNAGSYIIQALVSAPNDGANSFYVNIDGAPQDPVMVWDIPVTAGFEQRIVSWRGNGSDVSNQFVPKVFSLGVGTHQLVFAGREAGVELQGFSLAKLPDPPANIHVVSNP